MIEQDATLVCSVLMTRIELQHVLKAQERMIVAFKLKENVAKLFPQRGIIGPELNRLVESLERVFAPSQLLQR